MNTGPETLQGFADEKIQVVRENETVEDAVFKKLSAINIRREAEGGKFNGVIVFELESQLETLTLKKLANLDFEAQIVRYNNGKTILFTRFMEHETGLSNSQVAELSGISYEEIELQIHNHPGKDEDTQFAEPGDYFGSIPNKRYMIVNRTGGVHSYKLKHILEMDDIWEALVKGQIYKDTGEDFAKFREDRKNKKKQREFNKVIAKTLDLAESINYKWEETVEIDRLLK